MIFVDVSQDSRYFSDSQKYIHSQYLSFRYRSSHRRSSVEKGALKNFAKFSGKHLCWSLFFNKVAIALGL